MLEWFTTIPGVLVICGVVLLIIAIVLFVMGSKKGKTVPVNNNQMNNQSNFGQASITNTEVNVIDPTPTVEVNETPKEENGVINFTPASEPVVENNLDFTITEEPKVEENNLDFTITPENETIEPTINTVNIEPAVNPSVSIYGGYSPLENTQPEVKTEEPVIYGGEEVKTVETEPAVSYPSFATSDIPAYVEPTVTEPVIETPSFDVPVEEATPVVEPVVETPSFDVPAEETAPVVEPVVETPSFDIPTEETTPVVEPVIETPSFDIPTEEPTPVVEPVVETPSFDIPAVEEPAPVVEPVVETPSFDVPTEEVTPVVEPVVETPSFDAVIPEVQTETISFDNKEN